jgi:hypothetical protein
MNFEFWHEFQILASISDFRISDFKNISDFSFGISANPKYFSFGTRLSNE